ncbi:cell division protein FtsQ [Desulfohalotomaculum tongense]|uniref:cell division protein FtsQ/DivIB n=1 Tax=Desulforadius tongensis TaxID=1216062 RepID=UPI001958D586|nr:FtsQ-type POTRA domain-containing protein [Desulforadius tongensis]MBM7855217.1 cell division protein FtsQ [Desulforadius tongensis]
MTGVRPLEKRSKPNFLQGVFFILLVCLTVYVLLQSPIFNIRKIEIVGRNQISREKLVKLSGVVLGSNIFKVDLHSGEEKISLLPAVKEVKIKRRFPSTVVISITEREPMALLAAPGGFIELDKEGIYLRQGEFNKLFLPVITGCRVKEIEPGEKVTEKTVITALEVIDKLPPELTNQLSEVHVDNNKVTIYTIDGVQGRLGLPENIYRKGDVFLQVLNQMHDGKKIEYIDLTSFKSPVVKYAS